MSGTCSMKFNKLQSFGWFCPTLREERAEHAFFLSSPSMGIPSFGGACLALPPRGRSTPHRGVSLVIWLARPARDIESLAGHHGRFAKSKPRSGNASHPPKLAYRGVCKMSTRSIQQVCIYTSKPSWAYLLLTTPGAQDCLFLFGDRMRRRAPAVWRPGF